MPAAVNGMKECSSCREVKGVELFSKNCSRKDGLSNQCKRCRKKTQKKYKQSDKGKEAIKKHLQSDSYIIKQLKEKGITEQQITPKIIESQRQVISLKRIIKKLKSK